MPKYSHYQRSMLADSARATAAAKQTAAAAKQTAAVTERQLRTLETQSQAAALANAEMIRVQSEIARATAANNQLLVRQLEIQRDQLQLQREEAVRRGQEEDKRDRQAFAIWRQTPDGEAFTAWYGRAAAMAEEIEANDKHWRDAVEAIKSEWKSPRREQIEFATFNPDERNATIAKRFFIGAGVCAALWIVFVAAGVIGMVNLVFILGALGLAGAGVWRFFSSDKPQRAAALMSLRTQGTGELGFDPMSDEVPAWSTTDAAAYARQIRVYSLDAYRTHPPANSLPTLSQYQFVNSASIKSPALKQLLPH
ncbi:hypothetical protein L5G28_04585 [Gordonia sp. HY285]|uniref:hypothetical protein n=1 Tax=Gordonia liuliyuniae TaxID=2911517 RepID=UPI001F3A361C|nr:hypothetical protein [Gordonia liuliyuniae]MCF8609437.1 hypothetical protein [Gordonia liuliyuniae]